MVLDPCLQFPIGSDPRPDEQLARPCAAVYGHDFTASFSRGIRRWADERGLPLVSIGYRNDWAGEQWLTADPHDFAHFMARAAAVATNFFHGCVLALRNARPFACETTPYRCCKLQGLLAKLGAESHLLPEDAPAAAYAACLNAPLDSAIAQRIELLRQTSNACLNQALTLPQLQPA